MATYKDKKEDNLTEDPMCTGSECLTVSVKFALGKGPKK